eukprot:5272018-Pleurochrysis_carterae.AAC.3
MCVYGVCVCASVRACVRGGAPDGARAALADRVEDDGGDLPPLANAGAVADEEAAARAVRVVRRVALARVDERLRAREGGPGGACLHRVRASRACVRACVRVRMCVCECVRVRASVCECVVA